MQWTIGALLLGMAYGLILQRARFCFVSAVRDWFLFRSGKLLSGIGAGLIITTLGFALLSAYWHMTGQDPTGRLWVLPLGLHTVIGGLFFGFGMVLAAGCASGTLFRLGEGHLASLVALVAIIIAFPAGLWLRRHFDWLHPLWPMGHAWLPKWLGLPLAALLPIAFAAFLILLGRRSYALENEIACPVGNPADNHKAGLLNLFKSPWSPLVAGVALGLLNLLQTFFDRPWGISEPLFWLGSMSGDVSGFVRRALLQTRLSPLLVDVGIVLGAFLSAVAAKEFGLRLPPLRRLVQAGLGGAFMGAGIALAFGCNIGGIFSGLPSLSLTAWVFLVVLIIGVWLAVRLLRVSRQSCNLVDTRGEICPYPILMAKRAMESKEDNIMVLVDHPTALTGIPAEAAKQGYAATTKKIQTSQWQIALRKNPPADTPENG